MAKTKRSYKRKSDFNIIGNTILISGGLLAALLAKNVVAELYPQVQQSFYPYAIELGSGIAFALSSKLLGADMAKPILAGSLTAMALTGVSAMTANTNQSMLFQPTPKFLAY